MGFLNSIKRFFITFFKTLVNSIYSPQFYISIPQKKFSSALGYFLLFILLLSAVQSIPTMWSFLTGGQKALDEMTSQAKTIYPQELEIVIKDGKASTNVTEPYTIPFPEEEENTEQINLLVIDTATPFSIEKFSEYNTIAWLTSDAVFIRAKDNGQFRTFGLNEIPNTVINKELVQNMIDKFSPWLKLVTPLLSIFIFVGLFISLLFRLVYLLFLALLIWILTKIIKHKLPYGQSYKVGMYAITLGLVAEVCLRIIGITGFPFMVTLISLGVVTINLLSKTSTSPDSKTAPKPEVAPQSKQPVTV